MNDLVTYRQNGTGNAFLREIGCPCPQCMSSVTKAQTSGSLLIGDRKSPKYHLLFDCGLGVGDSLLEAKIDKVTHVFVSHNHPDHCLELDRLVQSQLRTGKRGGRELRLPCYCTAGTRRKGPDNFFPYLKWDRINVVAGMPITPCAYLGDGVYGDLGLGVALQVTPVLVYHGNVEVVPEPVIWVVEFGPSYARKKIVLGWDMLHLVPRYPDDDHDVLFKGPTTSEDLDRSHAVLRGADLLVLEGNTLNPSPKTGHISIENALCSTVPRLKPKGPVWLVHYSGHEDEGGPLSDEGVTKAVGGMRRKYGITPKVMFASDGAVLHFAPSDDLASHPTKTSKRVSKKRVGAARKGAARSKGT